MSERTIQADGVELATQTFGDPADPPMLLIMGVMSSMLWWPDGFCRRLAERGRFVIRYDQRDTGRSTTYPVGEPPYGFDELAGDAVRVLDGYGLPSAHLVGFSMGGMIAQLAALRYPVRFTTLTAMSTSPHRSTTSGLPGNDPTYAERAALLGEPDLTDRDLTIAWLVSDGRLTAGPAHPFDEDGARDLIGRDFDRATSFASAANHARIGQGGEEWEDRLGELTMPLLVIHGTADPVFPIAHGEALASAVPGATFVRLKGTGHELNRGSWDEIVTAIVAHTGGEVHT